MEKKRVRINYTTGILWDTPVFGRAKEDVESNLYYKDVEIYGDDYPSSIKTDLIESGISKVSFLEIFILKYLPLLVFVYVVFNVNSFYPSMVGLMVAAITFMAFKGIKRRYSSFFSNVFLALLFVAYATYFVFNVELSIAVSLSAIANYSIQYFFFYWLFWIVFKDIAMGGYKNFYKIDDLNLTYIQIFDDKEELTDEWANKKSRFIFNLVLIIMICFTAIIGGFDLYKRVKHFNDKQESLLINDKNDLNAIAAKNWKVLKERLDTQSQKVGINFHNNKKDLELMKNDFDKYVNTRVIAYETIRVSHSNKIMRVKDEKYLNISKKKPFYITPTFIAKYKGVYRWHFLLNGDIHVVMNTKAR